MYIRAFRQNETENEQAVAHMTATNFQLSDNISVANYSDFEVSYEQYEAIDDNDSVTET